MCTGVDLKRRSLCEHAFCKFVILVVLSALLALAAITIGGAIHVRGSMVEMFVSNAGLEQFGLLSKVEEN